MSTDTRRDLKVLMGLLFFVTLGADAYMNKKSPDLSSVGISVKIFSEVEVPAKHQFRLWTVNKNFLTDKSIQDFHDFCGSEQVNKFVHFPDQGKEDEDYTRNCSYTGDLIIVNTTFVTPPDPEEGVLYFYKIVDILPFTTYNAAGNSQTCRINNFGDELGLLGGILTRTNVKTGEIVSELSDIPESVFGVMDESIIENYIYYHQQDIEEGQADHVNKLCIEYILREFGVEQIRQNCEITCKKNANERIEL